jgi:hypothetical protein
VSTAIQLTSRVLPPSVENACSNRHEGHTEEERCRRLRSMRLACLLALTACASAPRGVPTEVRTLLEREEMCEHWAGEEPYDPARRQEIEAGIAASCPGNDAERARLEQKYRGEAEATRALGR